MLISMENKVLEKYPDAEIGYLAARVIVKKTDCLVEAIKTNLHPFLEQHGFNATNFVTFPSISIWRKIYEEDFEVKAKTYRSSLEALIRRVLTGKSIWNICNVVDLYNCCSILSLLPMGGYDISKISGDITIRYAKEEETFLGLGQKASIPIDARHIVYADNKHILCWLWNHKDAAATCIDEDSKHVLFFVDGFDRFKVQAALKLLAENLEKIHCIPLEMGILNKDTPSAQLCF